MLIQSLALQSQNQNQSQHRPQQRQGRTQHHKPQQKPARSASRREGLRILSQILKDQGFMDFHIESSSGLSHKNKLRPIDISRLLKISLEDFSIFPEWVSALPIAGRDGTLKRRFLVNPGGVRAKTGLLSGVVALAGYAGPSEAPPSSSQQGGSSPSVRSHLKSFVFIYNGKTEGMSKAKLLFDNMALQLTK